MSQDWMEEDDDVLPLLTTLAARVDPVPPDVISSAIGCFMWRSIDAELAELLYDSERSRDQLVGVRGQAGPRQLTFESPHLLVEVEVDLQAQPQLFGQLIPAGPADVEIRSADASMVVKADALGRFWADSMLSGAMSLHITPGGHAEPADTPWISITSNSN